MLGAIDHVGVAVEDLDAAISLYEGTLGMPVVYRETVEAQGVEAVLLDVGDGHVELLRPLDEDLRPACFDPTGFGLEEASPNSAPIALQVDDVEAAREALRERGVEFHVDMIDSGVCHQAIFSDPDGNPLILHHRYAPKDASPPS